MNDKHRGALAVADGVTETAEQFRDAVVFQVKERPAPLCFHAPYPRHAAVVLQMDPIAFRVELSGIKMLVFNVEIAAHDILEENRARAAFPGVVRVCALEVDGETAHHERSLRGVFHKEIGAAGKIRADALDGDDGSHAVIKSKQGLVLPGQWRIYDEISATAHNAPRFAPKHDGFADVITATRQVHGRRAEIYRLLEGIGGVFRILCIHAELLRRGPIFERVPRSSGVSNVWMLNASRGLPNRLTAGLVRNRMTFGPLARLCPRCPEWPRRIPWFAGSAQSSGHPRSRRADWPRHPVP